MQDRVEAISISHKLRERRSEEQRRIVQFSVESPAIRTPLSPARVYFACPHEVSKDTFTCRRDQSFHVIPSRVCAREFDARHP